MKNCPNCKKELPDEATFCPYCMTKLAAEQPGQPISSAAKGPNKKLLLAAVAAVAVAAIGLVVFFVLRSGKPSDSTSDNSTPLLASSSVSNTVASSKSTSTEAVPSYVGAYEASWYPGEFNNPKLQLNADGTFYAHVNLNWTMAECSGTYTNERNMLHLTITEADYFTPGQPATATEAAAIEQGTFVILDNNTLKMQEPTNFLGVSTDERYTRMDSDEIGPMNGSPFGFSIEPDTSAIDLDGQIMGGRLEKYPDVPMSVIFAMGGYTEWAWLKADGLALHFTIKNLGTGEKLRISWGGINNADCLLMAHESADGKTSVENEAFVEEWANELDEWYNKALEAGPPNYGIGFFEGNSPIHWTNSQEDVAAGSSGGAGNSGGANPTDVHMVVDATGGLHLRSAPSKDAESLILIPEGEHVFCSYGTPASPGWVYVEYPNNSDPYYGFVAEEYLKPFMTL